MGNRAGIENIDISPITRSYQPIARFSKLPGEKLALSLIYGKNS
jgi:hypothetical protein